jgi:hypothetical protein
MSKKSNKTEKARAPETRDWLVKYSPPWQFTTRHGKFTRVYVLRDSGGAAIAELSFFGSVNGAAGEQIAKLIVAAPEATAELERVRKERDELREACEYALTKILPGGVREALKAAIAKVEATPATHERSDAGRGRAE